MSLPRVALLSTLFLTFLLTAVSAAAEAPPPIIRLGSGAAGMSFGKQASGGVPGWVSSQHYVEKEFEKDGITIAWSHIAAAGPGANEALASSSVDFAYYGDFPAIIGKAGGLPTKLIVPGQRGQNSALIVPLESTATSLKDLVGKRISIQRGRPWELAFTKLLAANGLTEADFQIFSLTEPDGDSALLAGGVDAKFGSENTLVWEQHKAKTIWTTRSQPITWGSTADLFVTEDFAAKYPETTERVAKAFVRAAYDASLDENRQNVLDTWARAGAATPESVTHQYDGVALKSSIVPVVDPFLMQHYRDAIDYLAKAHLIRKPFAAENWIDPRFVIQALGELKLEHYWAALDTTGQPLATPATNN